MTDTTTDKTPTLGRPRLEDKRRLRSIKYSNAEWAELCKKAEKAGKPPCTYARERSLR
jgi:hypothetical protein